jgi:uncharacterized protein (DUF58 family)
MDLANTLREKLFRWQSDGTTPFRLGQRRIFVLPSRSGLLYAATLFVMLLVAINYNLALGYALVFLLTGLGLVGMIHTFRNLHGLWVSPEHCDPVFSGETAHFRLLLSNERTQDRPALHLQCTHGTPVTLTVNAEETRKISIPLTSDRRGWLNLPRIRLSTNYPLGLFTAWAYLHPAMRCLIYPAPCYSPLPPEQAAQIGSASRHEGGKDDFAGFREHQPADSLRHVAWKASARDSGNRPLLIKQFAGGSQAELQLDWRLTDPALDLETRLSILTGWVLTADAAGHRYGLSIPGCIIPPDSSPAHRHQCLEALALCQF